MSSPKRVPPAVLGVLALAAGYGLVSELGPSPSWPRTVPEELVDHLRGERPPLVLDVRTSQEFAAGHIPGAHNIYFRDLPARLAELAGSRERPVVVYCETGSRSRAAIRTLLEAGFTTVSQLDGDMVAWRRSGLPQNRPPFSVTPVPGA